MSELLPKIELKPSCILFVILLLLHLGAAVCLWFSVIALLLKLILSILCALSLYFTLAHYVFYAFNGSIRCLEQQEDGDWLLYRRDGDCIRAQLVGDSFINTTLALVNFKVAGRFGKLSVPLFVDSFKLGSLRQLVVFLHFN